MNTSDLFINPQTKLLRSGWRALAFLVVLTLPQWLASAFFNSGEQPTTAVFEPSVAMIFTYAVLVAWVVLVSWLCLRFLDRMSLRSLGFAFHPNWRREILLGFAISAIMVTLIVCVQGIGGSTRFGPNSIWWTGGGISIAGVSLVARDVFMALVLLILAGAFEELTFRGYAFQTLLRGMPAVAPILLLSIYFGLGHWENPNRTFFSTINTVLAGIWLAVAYLKTRSLWFPTALHFGWNWMMGAFYGLPVSGLLIPRHPILQSTSGSPVWLTGGEYGPEGGAAATIIILVSIVFLWRTGRLNVAPEMQAASVEPAQPEEPPIRLNLQNE